MLPSGTDQIVLEQLFGPDAEAAVTPARERTGDETPWQIFQERFKEDADQVFDQLMELATNGSKALVVAGRVVDTIPDADVRLKATALLLDRAFGKPRQQVEVSGGLATANVHIVVPTGEERAREVAEIMTRYGALPPEKAAELPAAPAPAPVVNGNGGNGNGNH